MPRIIRLFSRVAPSCCIVLGRPKSFLHRLGAERRSDGRFTASVRYPASVRACRRREHLTDATLRGRLGTG
jgi:hypothetical protein